MRDPDQSPDFRRRKRRHFAAIAVALAASCAGPSAPSPPAPPPPPVVGPATPPVIRSIAVPSARVEAGADINITAVVEDAETPLSQLAYQWTASTGTITGTSAAATFRVPAGIKAGADVVVTLTVTDTYDAVVNNVVVKQQFVVTRTSAAFRVHDSVAEVKELARKFLVDLFGNSSVPATACMVDFADICANRPEGRTAELEQIEAHRDDYLVISAQILNQGVVFFGADSGTVHSATMYVDQRRDDPRFRGETCGDFELTMVYVGNRWWICESYFNEEDTSHCPTTSNDGGVARILRKQTNVRGAAKLRR